MNSQPDLDALKQLDVICETLEGVRATLANIIEDGNLCYKERTQCSMLQDVIACCAKRLENLSNYVDTLN